MARDVANTILAQLDNAGVMIKNALSESEIQEAVAKVGYDRARLMEGSSLFDSATAIKDKHVAFMGAQKEATAKAKASKKTAMVAFQSYATLAKGAFKKSKENLSKLGLNKPMPRTEAGLIGAGKTLFDNAKSDEAIKTVMAKFGYDDAKLESEHQKILAFETDDAAQIAAEGAAQNSTDQQTSVMSELKEWTAQFRKAAKIALKDKKQLLEKLGIKVRSTRTKAQRGASKKAAATRAARKAGNK